MGTGEQWAKKIVLTTSLLDTKSRGRPNLRTIKMKFLSKIEANEIRQLTRIVQDRATLKTGSMPKRAYRASLVPKSSEPRSI